MGHDWTFDDVVAGLLHGDFSRLAPVFASTPDARARLLHWIEGGRFRDHPAALNEALACACFSGETTAAEFLLDGGADIVAGAATGLTGFHWAANRGQLHTVKMLIARKLPMEVRNAYGGTVLGGTTWAAVHEPKAAHVDIIQALLEAGADVTEAEYPSGDAEVDRLLRQYGIEGPQ